MTMSELQIYRISGGLNPRGMGPVRTNAEEGDTEPLLPTSILGGGSLEPIHPDDVDAKLYPAGVGPSGRKPGERRGLPPLMDS